MKKLIRAVSLVLLCCLVSGMTVTVYGVSDPSWQIEGGQVDDTHRSDLDAWLAGLDKGTALPHSGGKEVLASVIVENARSLVGKYPYVYGGESPEEGGFDCTGLVWYVYNRMSGLDITLSQAGRSKAALAAAGEKIYDHDAFLPGDVIQFTYAHVAIYVGGGRVVHARTTGTLIQETDLNYDNVEYAVRYPGVVQSMVQASGSCGDGVFWSLRTNGTLHITGSGTIENAAEETEVPWYPYRNEIVSVVIESSVTGIGDYAFFECENLGSVSASGVRSVGLGAFSNCGALTELTLSDCLESIGRLAFNRCVGLKSFILPETVISLGSNAFFGCSGLESVVLSKGLTMLDNCVFENCSSLKKIDIPDGVTQIGESAFFGCFSLTSVSIPKTVLSIGDWAFAYCDALSEITYSGLEAQWKEIRIETNNEPLFSTQVTLVCTGVPDAPQVSLSHNEQANVVILEWNEVRYADRYEIWRAVGNGVFAFVGKVEGTAYYDLDYNPGVEHFYLVRAVSGGKEGKWSDVLVIAEMRRLAGTPPR